MKKIISLVLAMVMVLAMGVTAFADNFVGSILPEYDIIKIRIIDDNNKTLEDLTHKECLIVTHIKDADRAQDVIHEEISLLKKVYKMLSSGEMTLPYAKYGYDPATSVMVDLYDATFLCTEHPEAIAPRKIYVELTLKANVSADAEVLVMTYKNDVWAPIVSAVNNGDGTVTCVFEDFCPIAISVVENAESNPSTGAPVFGAAAVVAAAACAVFAGKK